MKKWISYKNRNLRKEYMQDYYRRNRDRINDRVTQYCKEHDEHRRERRKQWYQENRELQIKRVKACQKKYKVVYPNMSKIEDQIANAKTWRQKYSLKKEYKRRKAHFKNLSLKAQERKKGRRKNRKETRIQARIDAWKQEVLDSTHINDEN